jgi:hypothetical protein
MYTTIFEKLRRSHNPQRGEDDRKTDEETDAAEDLVTEFFRSGGGLEFANNLKHNVSFQSVYSQYRLF